MGRIEAVIFDCDGVVVDSDELQVKAEQSTAQTFAEKHGLQYDASKHDWSSMQGWGRKKIAANIFDIAEDSELAETFRSDVAATSVEIASVENCPLVPGFEPFIDYISLYLSLFGLATASQREIYTRYDEIHSLTAFRTEYTVAHREAVDDKPKPGPYLEAMRRMNVAPRNTLVIEDSVNGIESGRFAGATVLGIATTKSPEFLRQNTDAHLVARNFKEAAHLLQPLFRR